MEFHQMRDCDAWRKHGLKMTTDSNECCKLYDAALTQYIRWYDHDSFGGLEKTIENLLNQDQNFILGHCLKSGLELIGTSTPADTVPLRANFNDFSNLYQKMSNELTQRERDHAEAIKWLFRGDVTKACNIWEYILIENPTDMMAIKFAHDAYFYLGYHPQMRDSVARVLPHWKPSMPLYSSLYGIYSFGLVQSSRFEQAKSAATEALEMDRNDAWATHSLCHYYEYSMDYESGIKFLNRTESDWSICNMLSSHNYWHLALYHIEKAEHETALEIFNKNITKNLNLGGTLDMVDAISLLYRLKLDCCDKSFVNEWADIAKIYQKRKEDHGYIFNDSHIAMMLSACGDKSGQESFLSTLNGYLTVDCEELPNNLDFLKKLNAEYAAAVFNAIFHFDNEEFDSVVDLLYPIRYEIIKIGGSNAQRDLFQQMLIQSALRSTSKVHNKIGLALLNERKALKVGSNLTERISSRFASVD